MAESVRSVTDEHIINPELAFCLGWPVAFQWADGKVTAQAQGIEGVGDTPEAAYLDLAEKLERQ